MYMRKILSRILMGCYVMAAILFVGACNDLYPLPGETFQLYYTSASTDQQTVDVYFQDSFGTVQQLTFSFNNDSSKEEY